MTRADRHSTKLAQLERVANTVNNTAHRIDRMAEALNTFVDPGIHRSVLRAPVKMSVVRQLFFRMQIKMGTQSLMTSLPGKSGEPLAQEGPRLSEWEFLSQQAESLVDSAEKALAREFYDVSLQTLIYTIDVISRIALSAEGLVDTDPAQKERANH